MASNFFGQIFRITTFGESHGPAIGVIVDGCPAGLSISREEIDEQLFLRRPGQNSHTSPRREPDEVEILSGLFEGRTTGAPIALLIRNLDIDSTPYETVSSLYRPGHAHFTYLHKYGLFDTRGGSRASARETAARVAAGAIAKKFLAQHHITCTAYLSEAGGISIGMPDLQTLSQKVLSSSLFCPDKSASKKIEAMIELIRDEGDSIGGIVSCIARIPPSLGDPIYHKLEAQLASAMLSIPASKGFEIGSGFSSARMRGSEHNDSLLPDGNGHVTFSSNYSGGVLGGISTGSPLFFRVAFKPASGIKKTQQTTDIQGNPATFQFPNTARHDPCIAIRAVPVVEAMTSLVLADALLMNRCATT